VRHGSPPQAEHFGVYGAALSARFIKMQFTFHPQAVSAALDQDETFSRREIRACREHNPRDPFIVGFDAAPATVPIPQSC
jgi:hypothetical protein